MRRRRARERNVRYSMCDVAMEFAEPAALIPSGTLSKCLYIATTSHILILTWVRSGPLRREGSPAPASSRPTHRILLDFPLRREPRSRGRARGAVLVQKPRREDTAACEPRAPGRSRARPRPLGGRTHRHPGAIGRRRESYPREDAHLGVTPRRPLRRSAPRRGRRKACPALVSSGGSNSPSSRTRRTSGATRRSCFPCTDASRISSAAALAAGARAAPLVA